VSGGAGPWQGISPGERPFHDAAWHYAEYRYRPAEAFLRLLAAHLDWSSSDRILDLGAGPAHLSLPLARFVGEVVAMDPEEAMIEEGRRRATDAAVENVSFIVGGSDDLAGLVDELRDVAAVVISQAFHWMNDQDTVLRALDPLVDQERGAVALVGYVKDPDYNRVWLDRPPWDTVEAILQRHLGDVPPGPNPSGRHDPFPDILSRSPFSQVELLTHEHDATVMPSIEAALGTYYSFANVLARLGSRRTALEADVRTALAGADTSPITVRVVDSALIGRRP
jgi:SAM-dependent methyltransferase